MAHLINQLVEKGRLIKGAMDERAWSLKGLAKKLLAEIKEGVLPWADWKESFVHNFQIRLNDTS